MKRGMNRRSQIWVETVIYTLIALVMIGAVLAFAKPKIEELQDQTIIEQSLEILDELDSLIINVVEGGQGNIRVRDLTVKKGTFTIDGENDMILYDVDSRYVFSQPGEDVDIVGTIAHTEQVGKTSEVNLRKEYAGNYDIKVDGLNEKKTLGKSSTPYKVSITNEGSSSGNVVVNFKVS